jgi:hypothetical protein
MFCGFLGFETVRSCRWLPAAGIHLQEHKTTIDNFILLKIGLCKISVDWIQLAQDMDQWRALGNIVVNLRVP